MTGYDAAKRLIGLESSPTAIFASNDVMAFGVMQAARELELTTPTDLSIVGFDDVPKHVQLTRNSQQYASPWKKWGKWRQKCSPT